MRIVIAWHETMNYLYDLIEQALPQHVINWVPEHIRRSHPFYALNNPRWREAFKRLNMDEEVGISGYPY